MHKFLIFCAIQVKKGLEKGLFIKKRELKSLAEASEELSCDDLVVISWDYEIEETFKDKKIKFIPL